MGFPPEVPIEVGVGGAAGWALQGRAALFVEWIQGCYTNVVGPPLALTGTMFAGIGISALYRMALRTLECS